MSDWASEVSKLAIILEKHLSEEQTAHVDFNVFSKQLHSREVGIPCGKKVTASGSSFLCTRPVHHAGICSG